MEKVIELQDNIKKLISRSECAIDVLIPKIVVIGSQASGKCSLIEAITGVDFMSSRDKALNMMRPVQIELIRDQNPLCIQFVNKKNKKCYDVQEARKIFKQQANTSKLIKKQSQQIKVPQRIKVYSNKVPNLFIIDIPSFGKQKASSLQTSLLQEQTQQIIEQIASSYIDQITVILNVSKVTDNLTNSRQLSLLSKIDAQNKQTIHILTKIDTIDQNLDMIDNFEIFKHPSLFGFISTYLQPNTVIKKHSFKQILQIQKEYFQSHEIYSKQSKTMGFPYLINQLSTLISKHFSKQIPHFRQSIVSSLQIHKELYSSYGQFDTITNKNTQQMILLNIISNFSSNYCDLISGHHHLNSLEQLEGGARIQYIFNIIFSDSIMQMNPFEYLNDDDIRTAVKNANGLRKSLFINQLAFENLVKQQIGRLISPSIECCRLIFEELKRFIFKIQIKQLERFRILQKKIIKISMDILRQCLEKTEKMVYSLIEIELGYINTNHPDFLKFTDNNTKSTNSSNNSEELDNHVKKQRQKLPVNGHIKEDIQRETQRLQRSSMKEFEIKNEIASETQSQKNIYKMHRISDRFPKLSLPDVPQRVVISNHPKAREITEINFIKKLIISYFNVVKKNISDCVPKTIVCFLITGSKQLFSKKLIAELYKTSSISQLFQQNQLVQAKRESLKQSIKSLQSSLTQLNKMNEKLK